MTSPALPALALGLLLSAVPALTGTASAAGAPATASTPRHTLSVTGDGAAMYPAFDPAVGRFGLTTTDATAGTVTVTATTSDPAGAVYVDGRRETDGSRTLTGLTEGDEIAVFIVDSSGTERHSLIYLPPAFPTLERVTAAPDPATLQPGLVLLSLSTWTGSAPFFQTAVDVNAVPAVVATEANAIDFKQVRPGTYTVGRPTTTPGRTGMAVVELDGNLDEVRRHETVGLKDTDGHDSILLPDGTIYLAAYEPNAVTGKVDSVIQRVDPDGTVGFTWTSAPYVAETVATGPDYAHLNAMQIMRDGDLLVSFRHLSSVFKIATHARAGVKVGDVVWKLGGRDSDFTFTGPDGEVDGGPCAQHAARELPNGHILMFDNGSSHVIGTSFCIDPADPAAAPIDRPQTRVVEFAVDPAAGTAHVVSQYAPAGRYAIFAGSAEREPNGNTLVGWASMTTALASEVDTAGNLLWEIRDPAATGRQFTYRATKAAVPDVTAPVVTVQTPAAGASYPEGAAVTASYGCTDRGGSSLQTCAGPAAEGQRLDTSTPGSHSFTVTGTDGAGGTTRVTRSYTVEPAYRPDAMVKFSGAGGYLGDNSYDTSGAQRLTASLRRTGARSVVVVRLQNDGLKADRIRFTVAGSDRHFKVLSRYAGRSSRTPLLQPGTAWRLTVQVVRRSTARPRDAVLVRVPTSSAAAPARKDAVSVLVTARR